MQAYDYIILAAGWIIWFAPFPLNRRHSKTAKKTDRRARWGMLLQAVSYSLLWQSDFWVRSPGAWRRGSCILFLALACLLSWTATRALGRHLRFDAALGPDHQLVRSGPYRALRHPIYTSMLCILWGTGFLITPLPLLAAATLVCLAGTEIRVRVEDNLLASHFGDEFSAYRQAVSAYIPLLR